MNTDLHEKNRAPIAVIGAAGFLGRSLVARLVADQRPYKAFTRHVPILDDGGLIDGAAECGTVVWLASSINPLVAEANPELVTRDLSALRDVVRAVADLQLVPRFVVLSSGGTVYGTAQPPPYSELSEPNPTSAYGEAKLLMEQEVLATLGDSSVMRIANAYGPGQPVARGQGVIAHWMRAIRRLDPVRVFGDTRTTRDYVFAADIADAIVRVCDVSHAPQIVNIGSGSPTTLADLLHTLLRVVDQDKVLVEYASGRSFDVPANYLDISVAKASLDWTPAIELEVGLSATWETVKKYGDPVAVTY